MENQNQEHYIVSFKHTRPDEPVITFWKPNNAGYTVSLEKAGKYTEIKEGYHTGNNAKPVPCALIDALSKVMSYGDFKNQLMLPSVEHVWMALDEPEIAQKVKSRDHA